MKRRAPSLVSGSLVSIPLVFLRRLAVSFLVVHSSVQHVHCPFLHFVCVRRATIMHFLPCLSLLLTGRATAQAVGQFWNPPNMPTGKVNYTENQVLHVGDTISVEWSTSFTDYTIAVWQQEITVDGAILGPIIYETRSPAKPEFLWTVQRYSFDIKHSAVFFLWLHPGDSSQQGDKRNASFATRYFNISSESASTSSTVTLPTSSTLTPASSKTASIITTSTSSPTTTTNASNSAQPGLSTGALAGIAASAGLAVILAIACAILWWRRHSGSLRDGSSTNARAEDHQAHIEKWQPGPESWHRQHYHDQEEYFHHYGYDPRARAPPVEMLGSTNGRHEAVELA